MKFWGLFKAFCHWCTNWGHETWIHSEGKFGEWTRVTRIYCGKCNKTFWQEKPPDNSNQGVGFAHGQF